MTTTTADLIKAATSLARDAADGTLTPETAQDQLTAELRALFAVVIGPGDPLWELQVEVCRGVLAAGGIDADELSEWAAVGRRRSGEAAVLCNPPTPETLPSGEPRAGNADPGAEPADGDGR